MPQTSARLQSGTLQVPLRLWPDGPAHSVLTLGCAQLGAPYGVANGDGMPTDGEAARILAVATEAGITALDTARAYGISEERIGKLLPQSAGHIRVVTKLALLSELTQTSSDAEVDRAVEASVMESLQALQRPKLDVLLLHRWFHRHAWQGRVWKRLLALKNDGVIGTLGVSARDPAEVVDALADSAIGHVQCPVNLLDGRWRRDRFLESIAARPDVIVHARSVLLQGVLTLHPSRWPSVPDVNASDLCALLDRLVLEFGRASRVDLCLAYVRALPWVTSIVIGVERSAQLETNIAHACSGPLSSAQRAQIDALVPALPEVLVNPALWSY